MINSIMIIMSKTQNEQDILLSCPSCQLVHHSLSEGGSMFISNINYFVKPQRMSFDGVGDHVGSRVNEFIRVLLRPVPKYMPEPGNAKVILNDLPAWGANSGISASGTATW